jgi:hypothetical protein
MTTLALSRRITPFFAPRVLLQNHLADEIEEIPWQQSVGGGNTGSSLEEIRSPDPRFVVSGVRALPRRGPVIVTGPVMRNC